MVMGLAAGLEPNKPVEGAGAGAGAGAAVFANGDHELVAGGAAAATGCGWAYWGCGAYCG